MAARLSARVLCRTLRFQLPHRSFTSSAAGRVAHNFNMPAMSPTMTEGNIASWKVKEGESFSVGDVLLEIETDKATMDVEAQDDGVMAKILAQDGSKSVKVGTRIAVLAEEGDDLSSLEIPPEVSSPVSKPVESENKADEPRPQKETFEAAQPQTAKQAKLPATPPGPGQNTAYPLYPSVIALVHERHIPNAEVAKIPATGPNRRLLKGDVLEYLGSIESGYNANQSKWISKIAHLDLSNIKILPPPEKPAETPAALPPEEQGVQLTDISLPISLSEVLKVQKRIQDTLGVTIPLSTFLARAVDIANDDLPVAKGKAPSPDELFDAVLGLDGTATVNRGSYLPQITALPPPPVTSPVKNGWCCREPDIIDILTGNVSARKSTAQSMIAGAPAIAAGGGAVNAFSLTVAPGEEMRARTFLERVKTMLQVEPGRLVL